MNQSFDGIQDPLEFFGANADEIDLGPDRKKGVSREVCVCGHPIAHHESVYEGLDSCQESKMFCPCRHKKAVLEVEDLRAFKFSSEGYGRDHALWKGLKKLRKMGKGATTLVDSICWKCLEERPIEPVSLTPENRVSRHPEARNVMVCIPCRYVLEGIDPSFIISQEDLKDVFLEADAPDSLPLGYESSTSGIDPDLSSDFVINLKQEFVDCTTGEDGKVDSSTSKGTNFQKLTEAPY